MSLVRRIMGTRFDNRRGCLFIVFYSYEVKMSNYMISMLDSVVDKHKGADRVK